MRCSAGTLPPGLLLASNGTLSGTPTTQGSFPFTVRVTDQEARTGTRAFTLEVRPAAVAGATVTLQTPNPSANTQQEVDVALSAPRTDVVEGTLILSFASSTTPSVDDLTVRFMNGSREQNFQIPQGN
ncbi:MAG: Ig domain-containing protein [Bryobacterales bacterium]|nr:Ig domain-containing protein [Bryobacterales bacterium]